MTKLPGLLATAAILAGTAVAGANAQETIKIGVTQPLTGAFAASGNYVAQGAKIAEDEINKAGGVLGKDDLVALKAHASPAFYAIQYLRGRLDADDLEALRSFGRLQAYPSRRKNPEIVDLSTGSMGLGAVQATFAALAARYLGDRFGVTVPGHVWVMVGDAELDEGNVWEALLEEAVPCVPSVTWIVDVNRQSLDRITPDTRPRQLAALFAANGWNVIELRWGARLRERHVRPQYGARLPPLQPLDAAPG